MKYFCIPITFYNSIEGYFTNKEYPVAIQTRLTQIVNSKTLIQKPFFNRI